MSLSFFNVLSNVEETDIPRIEVGLNKKSTLTLGALIQRDLINQGITNQEIDICVSIPFDDWVYEGAKNHVPAFAYASIDDGNRWVKARLANEVQVPTQVVQKWNNQDMRHYTQEKLAIMQQHFLELSSPNHSFTDGKLLVLKKGEYVLKQPIITTLFGMSHLPTFIQDPERPLTVVAEDLAKQLSPLAQTEA